MKFSILDLVQNGYRQFKEKDHNLYQKRVYATESGTRYFINVKHYDLSGYNAPNCEMFDASVHFNTKDDVNYDVTINGRNLTIDDLERRVEHVFLALGGVNYE